MVDDLSSHLSQLWREKFISGRSSDIMIKTSTDPETSQDTFHLPDPREMRILHLSNLKDELVPEMEPEQITERINPCEDINMHGMGDITHSKKEILTDRQNWNQEIEEKLEPEELKEEIKEEDSIHDSRKMTRNYDEKWVTSSVHTDKKSNKSSRLDT